MEHRASYVLFLSRGLGFHWKLIRWLTKPMSLGRVGTSPVKLANHFLEVKPPSTVAFERQLAVLAAARRSIRAIVMLHLRVVAGTPPGPNRDSSPSLVPWLLRCHIYSDTSCIPPFLKFGEQVLNQYGPAQVGFGYHC
jgi:hypothetical protein